MCEDSERLLPGEVFISVSLYFKECQAFRKVGIVNGIVNNLHPLDSPTVAFYHLSFSGDFVDVEPSGEELQTS